MAAMVKVVWVDCSGPDGWVAIETVRHVTQHIESLGFLLNESDESITITGSISAEDFCQAPLIIPRSAIREYFEFEF